MRFSPVAAFAVVASVAPVFSLPLTNFGLVNRALQYRDPMDYSDLTARSGSGMFHGVIGEPAHPADIAAREPLMLKEGMKPISACMEPGVRCRREDYEVLKEGMKPISACMEPGVRCRREDYEVLARDLLARAPFVLLEGHEAPAACEHAGVHCGREEHAVQARAPLMLKEGMKPISACMEPGVRCRREDYEVLARDLLVRLS